MCEESELLTMEYAMMDEREMKQRARDERDVMTHLFSEAVELLKELQITGKVGEFDERIKRLSAAYDSPSVRKEIYDART